VVADDTTGRILNQRMAATRYYKENGATFRIVVELRFDDQCKNGHESFAITANIDEQINGSFRHYMGGCCHDEIVKHFPELAHLIKWHLTSTSGPLHYLSNTLYYAGDLDCNGLKAGEVRQIRNGKTGLPCWKLEAVNGKPESPQFQYVPWNRTGEGKARELEFARSSAVWPEATDEQLSLPKYELKALLIARLPALLSSFHLDMVRCGFVWPSTVALEAV
jgi:hypothetical protein